MENCLEIALTLAAPGQAAVACDGAASHVFALAGLPSLGQDEHGHPLPPLADPAGYGAALFAALFPPGSPAAAAYARRPQRIVLVAEAAPLQAVHWEYLRGPRGWLVCDVLFARGLPTQQRRPAPAGPGALQVLVLPANPPLPANEPLPIDSEWENLRGAVQDAAARVTFTRVRPASLVQLRRLVAGRSRQVVHFIGHGNQDAAGQAYLCFEKDDFSLHAVSPLDFYNCVRGAAFLVTLNACVSAAAGPTEFSNLALALVREGTPYALGMQFAVGLADAQLLSRSLYSDLALGSSLEEALRQARLALSASATPWAVGIPVLYTCLEGPAAGFQNEAGTPEFKENLEQPRLELLDLPRPETPFYGRAAQLAQLGGWLTGPQRARLVTIHAGGGTGKTALARAAVERFAWAWPGGVWASGLERLPDHDAWLAGLAGFCGLEPDGLERAPLEQLLRARLAERQTLLVLDNAETFVEALLAQNENALATAAFLRSLFSETRCALLVTSREYLGWDVEQPLELAGLAEEEGARLFLRLLTRRAGQVSPPEAARLSRAVDGHPLSLRLLAGASNDSALSLEEFLGDADRQLGKAAAPGKAQADRHYNLENCLRTSWNVLPADLRADWLNLSIFNGLFTPDLALDLLGAVGPDAEQAARARLARLRQRGLLEESASLPLREGQLSFYRMPVAARLFAAQLPAEQHCGLPLPDLRARFAAAYERLNNWIYEHESGDSRAALLFTLFQDEFERALAWAPAGSPRFAAWLGGLAYGYGFPRRGLRVLEAALALVQGSATEEEAFILESIGHIYSDTGSPTLALNAYLRALEIDQALKDRQAEAVTLTSIGGVYRKTGQPQKALGYFNRALPIREEVGDRAGLAATLTEIGSVYLDIGQPQEALGFFNRALPICEEVGDRAGLAANLHQIGSVNLDTGQLQEALRCLNRALLIREEVGFRAGLAATLTQIGSVHLQIGQPQEALGFFNRALPIREEVGDRAGLAATLHQVGSVYLRIGQPQEALRCFNRALPILEEVGDRAGQAATLYQNGRVYLQIGQTDQAILLFEEGIRLDGLSAAVHAEAGDLFNLAEIFHARLGRTQEAIALLQRAIQLFEQHGFKRDIVGRSLAEHTAFLAQLQSGQPAAPGLEDLMSAIQTLVDVGSFAEIRAILETRPVLLNHPRVEAIFEQNIQQQQAQDPDIAQTLAFFLDLLRDAKANGIPAALARLEARMRLAEEAAPAPAGLPTDFVSRAARGLSGSPQDKIELFNWLADLAPAAQPADKLLLDQLQQAIFSSNPAALPVDLPPAQLALWQQILAQL